VVAAWSVPKVVGAREVPSNSHIAVAIVVSLERAHTSESHGSTYSLTSPSLGAATAVNVHGTLVARRSRYTLVAEGACPALAHPLVLRPRGPALRLADPLRRALERLLAVVRLLASAVDVVVASWSIMERVRAREVSDHAHVAVAVVSSLEGTDAHEVHAVANTVASVSLSSASAIDVDSALGAA